VIDIEFAVFNAVSSNIREMYPDAFVTGDLSFSPATFPAVSIVETANSVHKRSSTEQIENAASVTYEVNVYSKRIGYGKMEAKDIISIVDSAFARLGFTRTFCNPIQNLDDKSIYRIVARYDAVVDKDFWIYRS
jgi:hypothetical protein